MVVDMELSTPDEVSYLIWSMYRIMDSLIVALGHG